MDRLFLLLHFFSGIVTAQVSMELTPAGFAPFEVPRPALSNEKLTELTSDWAANFNRREFDVYDITPEAMKVDGFRTNAFFYRNRGETYFYSIRYTLSLTFGETLGIHFIIRDIYIRQNRTDKTIADFFAPDGRLKSDFIEVKPSLEESANAIVNSYISFISR